MNSTSTKTDEEIIAELQEKVAKLEDENASLWHMIDEIWASDIKEYAEVMQRAHNEILLDRYMLQAAKSVKAEA